MRYMAVITGTFNPVTKAHIAMGKLAKEKLGNDTLVVYVPSRGDFLSGWKGMEQTQILSEDRRLSLLRTVLPHYGFTCDACEIHGEVSGFTFDTMTYLSDKHGIPKDKCYYVCGSDKLPELYSWQHAIAFISTCRFLVFSRNHENVEKVIASSPVVSSYPDHFIPLPGIPQMETLSASQIRESVNGCLEDFDWAGYINDLLS